jgi:hypothetical protein
MERSKIVSTNGFIIRRGDPDRFEFRQRKRNEKPSKYNKRREKEMHRWVAMKREQYARDDEIARGKTKRLDKLRKLIPEPFRTKLDDDEVELWVAASKMSLDDVLNHAKFMANRLSMNNDDREYVALLGRMASLVKASNDAKPKRKKKKKDFKVTIMTVDRTAENMRRDVDNTE